MDTTVLTNNARVLETPIVGDFASLPPNPTYHYASLPKTRLHYVKCGQGPPLIVVPATVSHIDDWLPLIQLMGLYFTAYFFELPGHGKSSAFAEDFSSDLVAETVEDFANHLGYDQFSLMGFSFGGVLAMKTLARLEERIDQVILIAPALTKKALTFSKLRYLLLQALIKSLQNKPFRNLISNIISSRRLSQYFAALIQSFGKVDSTIPMTEVFQKIMPDTLETLANQFDEILNLSLRPARRKYSIPCYFAMSVNDTMLDYQTTFDEANMFFDNITLQKFYFHYHQPPKMLAFEEWVAQFGDLLRTHMELRT